MIGLLHPRITYKDNVKTPLNHQYYSRYQPIELRLDRSKLDSLSLEKWLSFIRFATESLAIKSVLTSFVGLPLNDHCDFAYITDSSALSRKLLLNVPVIYIQPQSAPQEVDLYFYLKALGSLDQTHSFNPVVHSVTLISSVFDGDEYLPGFLDNCMKLQGYGNCEHFLIRPGSPGNEHEKLVEHVQRCSSSVYINLAEDPKLYEVWNLGTRLATSRYISNANIDDCRAPQQVIHLKGVLDNHLDVTVASTALRISKERNLEWKDAEKCEVWFGNIEEVSVGAEGLFEEREGQLVSRNFLHCMPLWRRSLHAYNGEFDEEKYGPSADWAFWVHAGMQGALFHLSSQPLGLYLKDEKSYWRRDPSHRKNDQRIVEEFTRWAKLGIEPARRHRSISREISYAIMLLSTGAIYEGLGRLLDVGQQKDRLGATELALLNQTAEKFLGCNDFVRLSLSFRNALDAGQLFDSALFNIWIELVNSLDSKSAKVGRTLELACIDLNECGGDCRGLLLQALLAHNQGNIAYERLLRKHLLDTDPEMFYKTLLGFSCKLS